jgi:hypothetical protein
VREINTPIICLLAHHHTILLGLRSPWSNQFFPKQDANDDAEPLVGNLRKLEVYANEVFDVYRQQ